MYKVLVLVFKCLRGTSPLYLQDLLQRDVSAYSLRSADKFQLKIARTNTKVAERSFRVSGPKWWNALPTDLQQISNESAFRRQLKTFLFRKFYSIT